MVQCHQGRHRMGDPKLGHGQRGTRCRTHHCYCIEQKNQVAMVTGHVEILRTLKSLCNPDPSTGAVPWNQVEAAMIKNFGPTVKDAAYYKVRSFNW